MLAQIRKKNNNHNQTHDADAGTQVILQSLVNSRHYAKRIFLSEAPPLHQSLAGNHLSRQQYRGVEFADIRPYQAGDEIRYMDWRVTARTGKPHVKLFHPDQERSLFAILDFQQSMYFGSQRVFKSVQAALFASILAWAAHDQGDSVGGVLAWGNEIFSRPARLGKSGLLSWLQTMVTYGRQAPETNLTPWRDLIVQCQRVAKPGSLIWFIGDFYSFDATLHHHLIALSQYYDLAFTLIYDPLEQSLPSANTYGSSTYSISNGEDFLKINNYNDRLYHQYEALFAKRYQNLQEFAKRYGISFSSVATKMTMNDLVTIIQKQCRELNLTKV